MTALLIQSNKELEDNISIYRKAREENGFDPKKGIVTLMLHTFMGETEEEVRKAVKEPFTEYLASSVQLWRQVSKDLNTMDGYKRQKLLDYAFEKYFHTAALFGSKEQCIEKAQQFSALGIDEIACLIDFGPSLEEIQGSLNLLRTII